MHGAATKISFLQLPEGFATEEGNLQQSHDAVNFQILIKKHCIIGFIVEPFDMHLLLASIPAIVAN